LGATVSICSTDMHVVVNDLALLFGEVAMSCNIASLGQSCLKQW
jgi:hypothetical protein